MKDKEFELHFELTTGTEITKYVKYYLDEYSKDTSRKPEILEKLKVIFSKESEYKVKILHGDDFIVVFKEKIRRKRINHLKIFLMEIDSDNYSRMNYQW